MTVDPLELAREHLDDLHPQFRDDLDTVLARALLLVAAERDELRRAYQSEHHGLLSDALKQTVEAIRWETKHAALASQRDQLRAALKEACADIETLIGWHSSGLPIPASIVEDLRESIATAKALAERDE